MGNVTGGTKIPCRVRRTLDVGDFSILHQLTWFNMAIHSDAEYAKGTWFSVLFGDTLGAEAKVVALRPTKNPERFLFVYQNKTYNFCDTTLALAAIMLVRFLRRPIKPVFCSIDPQTPGSKRRDDLSRGHHDNAHFRLDVVWQPRLGGGHGF